MNCQRRRIFVRASILFATTGGVAAASVAASELPPPKAPITECSPAFYHWQYQNMAVHGSALVHHPHVRLMSRPRWHTTPNGSSNPNPPGLESKTYTNTLEGFAEWMADWQEYSGALVGRCSMGSADNYENSAYIAHGQGFYDKSYTTGGLPDIATYMLGEVCRHPDDALPTLDQLDGSNGTEHPWYYLTQIPPAQRTPQEQAKIDSWDNDYRLRVWYNSNGIKKANEFMAAFMPILKTELDSRDLCYFGVLTHDLERHNSAAHINAHSSQAPDGYSWWTWAMEDPRFSTEVILVSNSVSYTFEDLWKEARTNGVPAPNLAKSIWHEDNREWEIWYHGIAEAMLGYVLEESLSKPWKRFFPETRVGNYRNALTDNPNHPMVTVSNQNVRWVWNYHHNLDYSTKSLYFANTANPELLCNSQYFGGFFPCSMSKFDMWREYNLLRYDAMANASVAFDIIPWIAMPHFRRAYGVFRDINDPIPGATPDHCDNVEGWCYYNTAPGGNPWVGVANTEWLLKELVDRRVKEFAIWGPDLQGLQSGNFDPEWQDADEFLDDYTDLIDDIVAYAATLPCIQTNAELDTLTGALLEFGAGHLSVDEFLKLLTKP